MFARHYLLCTPKSGSYTYKTILLANKTGKRNEKITAFRI